MKPFALALSCFLPLLVQAQPGPPDGDYKREISDFVLRTDKGGRTFLSKEADGAALGSVARVWTENAGSLRVRLLAVCVMPGSKLEARLVQAMANWTGDGRIKTSGELVAFLNDAADKAVALLNDPKTKEELGAQSAGKQAVERARQLNEKGVKNMGPGVFGRDRSDDAFVPRAIVGGRFSRAKLDLNGGAGGAVARPVKFAPPVAGAVPEPNPIKNDTTKAPDKL